ncbi:MAG: fibronectin type III domain-containing protein, partial [Chitinophagaceae bacterium]|nr:fibronectin type III domain-containing protein [Chitinophagaceae bacterium]
MKIFTNVLLTVMLFVSGLLVQEVRAQSVLDPTDSVYTYNSSAAVGSPNNPNLPALNSIGKWIRTVRLNWNTNMWKAYVYNGPNGVGVPFRLLFPKSYNPTANDGKKYPILIFFHGVGEAGPVTDNEYSMANGGPVFTNAVTSGAFDGFVFIMQSTGSWGPNHNTYITNIINYMVANNKLDPYRVMVNGLSAGGYNSWNFIETYPQYIAAALPMSGVSLVDNNYINTFKYTPIWLFQGGLDGSPDPGTAANVVSNVNNAGGNIKETLYPTLGHGTWWTAWGEPDFFPFCVRAYASNPWTLFGRTQFCPGDPVNVTIGVAPGYDAYQWRKDGVVLSGTTNSITATQYGTYDCRVQRLGIWSDWSHTPVVLSIKQPTITPPISVSGLMSDAIPAADGNNYVNLQVPDSGYTSYTWKKVGSDSVIGTTRILKATRPGQYIVSVTQQFGCSSIYSPPFTVINANGPNPPSPASNLVAHALSFTQVDLNWARNPNPTYPEAAFEIYRSTTSGGPYTYAGQAPANTVHYTDQGLKPNVKYYYVVRAIDSTAAAPLSNESSATTQSDQTPPSAPQNVTVTGTTSTSVSLSWNAATDNVGVTGYYVYVNGAKSFFTTDTFYTVNALATKQQFAFSVVAMDGSGNASTQSNQVTAATINNGLVYKYYTTANAWSALPNFSTLTPVSTGRMPNVSINGTTQSTNFGYTWSGYIRIPVAGTYTFATTSDDGSALWFNTSGPTGTPLVNNDGLHGSQTASGSITLQPGTYPIFIEYFQAGGGYNMSVSWACTNLFGDNNQRAIDNTYFTDLYTPADVAPAIPTVVKAVATSYNKVKINWTDNSSNETGFEIYRSTSFSGTYSIVSTVPANTTSFVDSTVQASTKYFYRVQAINKYGSSGFDPLSVGGIQYAYYQFDGNWSNMSLLNTLTPVFTGVLTNITNSPTTRSTNYAFKYQGTINIPTTGTYTFYTSSDDGSNLYIGGYDSAHLVVQNDFLQGPTQRSGTITLNQGSYPFYVTYFQAGGGAAINVSYKGPGFNQVAIPDSAFVNNQAVTTTFPLPAVPVAPYSVTASALSATAIGLSWQDTSATVTGFQLYRSVADSTHFIQLTSFPANVFSYTDTGLFSNQTYYYKLLATGVGGNSPYSSVVNATTKNTPPVITKLSDTSMRYG